MRRFLHPILLLLFLCSAMHAGATNYYFSSSIGDDSRTSQEATHPETPWKTIDKLNTVFPSLQPGDSVLFKRGDSFFGALVVKASGNGSSPITLGAWGNGSNPTLTGLATLSGWTNTGNVWKVVNSGFDDGLIVVTRNGLPAIKGRFPNVDAPNKGYLQFESHVGNTQITDNDLPLSQNWAGAEIAIRKNRHVIDRGTITSQSGSTINYTGTSAYDAIDGFGYFIQNHPATLDQEGEWYYDKSNHQLSVYLNGGHTPGNQNVKPSLINTLLQIWSQSNISITNINFEGANQYAVDAFGTNNVVFKGCTFSSMGVHSFFGISNNGLTIDSCRILQSLNNGIFLLSSNSSQITRCTVTNTGIYAGMGGSGDDSYFGINITGNNNQVINCTVDSSGFGPIFFKGDNTVIKNNLVSNFNFVKDDVGGIYTWTGSPTVFYTGCQIISNVVLNGTGAGIGTNAPNDFYSEGIYMDAASQNITVSNNTVANCYGGGIYLHNASNCTIQNNTSYNNQNQLLLIQDQSPIRNNSVTGNILFSKQKSQPVSRLVGPSLTEIGLYSFFDYNYYCRPIDDNFVIQTEYLTSAGLPGFSVFDLNSWKSTFNTDLHSQITGTQIPPYTISNLGPNKFTNQGFNTSIDSAVVWSSTGICHAQWANGEALDGGALKVYFDATPLGSDPVTSYVIMYVGPVDTAKQYILRFSLKGTGPQKSLKVYLRKEGEPYNQLVRPQYCALTSTRSENEFLVSFPQSQPYASIIIEGDNTDGTFYVDNVQLSEATVTPSNADDFIRFEYNASNNAKTVDLGGVKYVDVTNKPYSGSVTLSPWTSLVLVKSLEALPVRFISFYGNPVQNDIQLNWLVSTPPEGSRFEIERSADAVSFSRIGGMDASPAIQSYQFTDASPFKGSNYYRIREIDADGAFVYSKTILVSLGTGGNAMLWPNPASDRISWRVPQSLEGRRITTTIQNAAGALMYRKEGTVGGSSGSIDVSRYSRGVYVMRMEEKGEVLLSKLFVLE